MEETNGANIRHQPWGTPQPFRVGRKAKISLEMICILFSPEMCEEQTKPDRTASWSPTRLQEALCLQEDTQARGNSCLGLVSEDVFIEQIRIQSCNSVKKVNKTWLNIRQVYFLWHWGSCCSSNQRDNNPGTLFTSPVPFTARKINNLSNAIKFSIYFVPAEIALQKRKQQNETEKSAASHRHHGSVPHGITPLGRWQVPLSFCYII